MNANQRNTRFNRGLESKIKNNRASEELFIIQGPDSKQKFDLTRCVDKTILRQFYLHNGISYTDKTASLNRIGVQIAIKTKLRWKQDILPGVTLYSMNGIIDSWVKMWWQIPCFNPTMWNSKYKICLICCFFLWKHAFLLYTWKHTHANIYRFKDAYKQWNVCYSTTYAFNRYWYRNWMVYRFRIWVWIEQYHTLMTRV